MCEIKDAKRHIELAKVLLKNNKKTKARENYLEAVSIYLLQAEILKDEHLVEHANECYKISQEIIGNKITEDISKKELARIYLRELKEIRKNNKETQIQKQHNKKITIKKTKEKNKQNTQKETNQGEEEMCNDKSIMTLVKLGKELEKEDPGKAATNYLNAAEMLLEESKENPDREDEYITLANKMYIKAKELKNTDKKEIITSIDSSIKFNNIGGLKSLKEDIYFKIIEPLKNPELFKFYNKSIGGGLLIYGPPGCGKSLIAKATANEIESTFMHVKCSDLKSKYVGETEQNIAELFKTAREKQPCVIFFDEFEALGCDRTNGLAHEKSAVAQLLTEIDGMDSKDQQILLLAATNEPWSIDPALRREGRFGKTIYVPRPDYTARKQIIKIEMKNRPTAKLNLDKIAKLTDGFSGADIKSVCETATDIPLRESMITKKRRKITMQDMIKGVKSTQSVMLQWFQKARDQIVHNNLKESFKEIMIDIDKIMPEEIVISK